MRIAYANLLPERFRDERFLRAPLACGYLAAYATATRGNVDHHDVVGPGDLPAYGRDAADVILRSDPELVALSVYVWNVEDVSALLRELRRRRVDIPVVLGGPEVQFTPERALRQYDADFVCTGEGEAAFLGLVERLAADRRFRGPLPGIAARSGIGGPAPLLSCLDDIPSPFRTGAIDVPSSGWVDLETLRGCPFTCAFCLYGKNFTDLRSFSLPRIRDDVAWVFDHGATDVYFLDPTFNLPRGRCRDILDMLAERNRSQRARIYVEARAEAIDDDVADRMVAANVVSVEVGLQAVDTAALELMHRRLGRVAFQDGLRRLRDRGIAADIGIIVGLPGDTAETIRSTVAFATEESLGEVSAYRLQVLPGSPYWAQAGALGIDHSAEPPYFVRRTPLLSASALDRIEAEVAEVLEPHNERYRQEMRLSSSAGARAMKNDKHVTRNAKKAKKHRKLPAA